MQTVTAQLFFLNAGGGGACANVLPVLSDGAGGGSSSCSEPPVCVMWDEVSDAYGTF